MATTTAEDRDGRILSGTHWASLVVFAILVPALVILWGMPDRTADAWAWTIKPDLTPIFLGAPAALGVLRCSFAPGTASAARGVQESVHAVGELAQHWLQPSSGGRVCVVQLGEESSYRRGQCTYQLFLVQAGDHRGCEGVELRCRQLPGPLGVVRWQTVPQARQADRVVAQRADPVLGVPRLLSGDRDPGVCRMVPAQADQVISIRLTVLALDWVAEDDVESAIADGAEGAGRRKPEVDLQAVGEEEGPVGRRAGSQVEVVDGSQIGVDPGAPVGQDITQGVLSDAEEQVDVRPAVLHAACG